MPFEAAGFDSKSWVHLEYGDLANVLEDLNFVASHAVEDSIHLLVQANNFTGGWGQRYTNQCLSDINRLLL